METPPRVGDIVHYIPSDEETSEQRLSDTHLWEADRHYASMVVRVLSRRNANVILMARFSERGIDGPTLGDGPRFQHQLIPRSSTFEPGTWHSREECDR